MSRWPRLTSVTLPPFRWTRVRKPSHLGSYSHCGPSGIWPGGRGAASIGSMSRGMGSVTAPPEYVHVEVEAGRAASNGGDDRRWHSLGGLGAAAGGRAALAAPQGGGARDRLPRRV